jgi:transcription initiation factor IIF auxiliary subunit
MSTELAIRQWEQYEGSDWWKWAVWIEGSDEALDGIDHVEWTLHPTFPDPVRKTSNRSEKFRIETGGWGVFQIRALARTKDGSSIRLTHQLSLHYPDGRETTA